MTRVPARPRHSHAVGLLLLLGVIVTCCRPVVAGEPTATKFLVVGYLPEYRVNNLDETVCQHLDELVFFSVEPRSNGTLDTSRLKPAAVKLLRDLKRKYRFRLRLCVGGWERSAAFAACSTNDTARRRFINQMITYCHSHGFDGVDLDWEHPKGAAQQAAYTRLIVETQAAFSRRKLSVTAAIAGWQQLSAVAAKSLDRIHLMSYDAEGRHSTLQQAQKDIQRLRDAGIPADRICLGLPFYGRSLDKTRTAHTYAEIVRRFAPASTVDQTNGIYFNGPSTIRRKTRLAASRGLAGVSIWEIGQDARGPRSLLRVISQSRRTTTDRR